MPIVHSQAIQDAVRVLEMLNTVSNRIGQAYELLRNTGAAIDIKPFQKMEAVISDVQDEAHKVVLEAIDSGIAD